MTYFLQSYDDEKAAAPGMSDAAAGRLLPVLLNARGAQAGKTVAVD